MSPASVTNQPASTVRPPPLPCRFRERKELSGTFAIIPSLLKSVGAGAVATARQLPAGTSDAYRGALPLPKDYSYEQWQADLRRWEEETGMTYEAYLRGQGGAPGGSQPRAALPGAGRVCFVLPVFGCQPLLRVCLRRHLAAIAYEQCVLGQGAAAKLPGALLQRVARVRA